VLAEVIVSGIQHEAVIDGGIVHLGPDGMPRFYDLMRRRSPQHFYAFDMLWIDGRDLRPLPLLRWKAMLHELVRPPVLYVDHVARCGVDLFRAVCEQDLEGIVAKLASGRYEPEATTWVKIKNWGVQSGGRASGFLWWTSDVGFKASCLTIPLDALAAGVKNR
jgi:bifunctional non-homologous end joining protein LigD